MKTVALVFTILGMIVTFITSSYNFCVYLYANYVTMAILSLVLGVLSVLFGIFAIFDLNKNRKRIWVGVCSLIFLRIGWWNSLSLLAAGSCSR